MNALVVATAVLTVGWLPQSDAAPLAGTDGQHRPLSTEAVFNFSCGAVSARLGYRQSFPRTFAETSRPSAFGVSLEHISVNGRPLPHNEHRQIAALLASYAWVEEVDASCLPHEITLSVRGAIREPFVSSVRTGQPPPRSEAVSTILLAPGRLVRVNPSEQISAPSGGRE